MSGRNPRWAKVETYPCARCGAEPGQRCRTEAGKVAKATPHMDRIYAADDAAGWRIYRDPDDKRYATP